MKLAHFLLSFIVVFFSFVAQATDTDVRWSGVGVLRPQGLAYHHSRAGICGQILAQTQKRDATQEGDRRHLYDNLNFIRMDSLSYILATVGDVLESLNYKDASNSKNEPFSWQTTKRHWWDGHPIYETHTTTKTIYTATQSLEAALNLNKDPNAHERNNLGTCKAIFPLPFYLVIIDRGNQWELQFNPNADQTLLIATSLLRPSVYNVRFPYVIDNDYHWPKLQEYYIKDLMNYGPLAPSAAHLNIGTGSASRGAGAFIPYASGSVMIPRTQVPNIYLVVGNYIREKSGLAPFATVSSEVVGDGGGI